MRPLIVGIAGGSGSGKTHLANRIIQQIGPERAATISMDQYFLSNGTDQARARQINFDHPSHLDFDRLMGDVEALRAGKSVWTPTYDFKTMAETPHGLLIHPSPVIVVEGLFVLADPMVSLCDLSCFLDVADDERLLGRILRDIRERGTTIDEVIDRYQRFVRPSYHVFVAPTKQNADVVVDFTYRREFFAQMLFGLLRGYVEDGKAIEQFVREMRTESYRPSLHAEDGFMSMTTDIFKLARAYPEKAKLREVEQPMASPAATSFCQPG